MPGVVCIENMSLVIVVVLCIIIVALLFSRQASSNDKIIIKEEHIRSDGYSGSGNTRATQLCIYECTQWCANEPIWASIKRRTLFGKYVSVFGSYQGSAY